MLAIVKSLLRNALMLGLVLVLASFNSDSVSRAQYSLTVPLSGEDFTNYASKVFDRLELDRDDLDLDVFEKALRGYLHLLQSDELDNDRFLTIIDYSSSCKKRRLWVIDLYNKQLLVHDLVAHGKNSGQEFAQSFSNRFESRKTSLGFYVTGSIYNGKHRLSLKLKGLEYGYNHNAFARGIVFHGAHYVNESIVAEGQNIGRSFGCPAVSQEINASLVNIIKNGSCIFFYYPDRTYLSNSKIVNSKMYVSIQTLKALAE